MKNPTQPRSIGIILTNTEGEINFANDTAKEILYTYFSKKIDIQEIIESLFKGNEYVKTINRLIKTKGEFYKILSPHSNNTTHCIELSIFPFYCPHTSMEGSLITIRDISEDIKKQRLLIESEEKFRKLAEATPIGVLMYSSNKWIYLNPAVERISGYKVDELFKMNFWDIVHPEFKDMVRERGLRRQKGEHIPPYEFKIITRNGQEKWIYLAGSNIEINGENAGIVTVIDITQQKVLEEKLRKREERYKSILENMEEGYFETDLKGNLTFFNKSLLKIAEAKDPSDLIGLNYRVFSTAPSAKKMFKIFHRVYMRGNPELLEDYEIITFKGNKKIIEISTKLLKDQDGNSIGFSGIVRDVTEKKSLTRELIKSRQYYRAVFENAACATIILDKDLIILHANQIFEDLFKINKVIVENRRDIFEFIHPSQKDYFLEFTNKLTEDIPTSEPFELICINALQEKIHILCSISKIVDPEQFIVSFLDVTQLKEAQRLNLELERQLRLSQKMEGIGLLASGLAHDFNNILQGIYANLLFLEKDLLTKNNSRTFKNIEKLIERGSRIIKGLLSYGRATNERFIPTNINGIIKDITELFTNTLPKYIKINTHLNDDLPNIHGNPTQIQQVFMNLLTNAVDAMDHAGGSICILTKSISVKNNPDIKDGEYVYIEVKDTGCGIPEDIQNKIFDPFFSTKETSRGTGLGLSVVYGIIRDHQGYIFCSSNKGSGTIFKIYLPAISTGISPRKTNDHSIDKTYESPDINGKDLKVLFIEDEQMILDTSCEYLKEQGISVTCATNGKEALEIFTQRHKEFDIIILDMNLPEISGMELLRKFLKIEPKKKIILSTGYSRDIVDLSNIAGENVIFLQKPYALNTLYKEILGLMGK